MANEIAVICVLNECTNMASCERGADEMVHAVIMDGGSKGYLAVENSLINMYGKCGFLEDAKHIFDRMY